MGRLIERMGDGERLGEQQPNGERSAEPRLPRGAAASAHERSALHAQDSSAGLERLSIPSRHAAAAGATESFRMRTMSKRRGLVLVLALAASSRLAAELPAVPVPVENPITEPKRVLGKILFWDEQLSSDGSVACGTCHRPAAGGADPRTGRHPGIDKGTIDDVMGSPGIVVARSRRPAAAAPAVRRRSAGDAAA